MKRFKQMFFGIVFAASLPIHAQPNFEKQFLRLDKDRNGEVSWREAYPMRTVEFTKLDTNFDGAIEKSEFRDRTLPFTQFDANADGKLELSEYVGQHHAMFKKADINGNSSINLQEFTRIQQAIRGQSSTMKNVPR